MQLALAIPSSTSKETIEVSEAAFGREYNESLVHQVVTACLANLRQGSKAQKTRSECSGGGVKPWKQKGTGRARAGTIRSPLWRGGGIIFAAKPRSFQQKVNKKMYQTAMRSILSELIRQDRLVVVKDLSVNEPKTKLLLSKLNDLSVSEALIVKGEVDETTYLAARNLAKVDVVSYQNITPLNLLRYKTVILTEEALRNIEEVLKQ